MAGIAQTIEGAVGQGLGAPGVEIIVRIAVIIIHVGIQEFLEPNIHLLDQPKLSA